MNQIKAQYVQACIFTPQDKGGPAQYPAQEQYLYQMFGNAIVELRKLHGPSVPVFLDFCPVAGNSDNLIVLEQNGGSILNLPAVQIYAKYNDGTSGQYFLKKGITDQGSATPLVDENKALAYMQALLYRLSPTPETLLCKLFPPLCSLGWYFWAAAGAYSVYRTTQARNVGKIVWGAASALTINEFIQRGGLKELGKKVGMKGIGELTEKEMKDVLLYDIKEIIKLKERRNKLPKRSNKRLQLQTIIEAKEADYKNKREAWGFSKY